MKTKATIIRCATLVLAAAGLLPVMAGDIVYVKAGAGNTEPYDSEATACISFKDAVAYAKANSIGKVKIVGTVTESTQVSIDISGLEVFGVNATGSSVLKGAQAGSLPNIVLGENAFLHTLKLLTWRAKCGLRMTADTACISNCWVTGMYFTTGYGDTDAAGYHSAGLVTHCKFTDNHNQGDGTIFQLYGTAKCRDSVFYTNYISGKNGSGNMYGIITLRGNAEFENNVVYDNFSQVGAGNANEKRYCGGIYIPSGSPKIRNCIVINNTTSADGVTGSHEVEKNWYVASGATPVIENCCTPDAPAGAVDCIAEDPQFTDAAHGDFSIAAVSPCVDAGCFAPWQNTATDYAGNPRYSGENADIGVFEIQSANTPVKAYAEATGQLSGYEKYAAVHLSGSVAAGTPDANTVFSWYTVDPTTPGAEPLATGADVDFNFTAGTWPLYLKVTNLPGESEPLVRRLSEVVTVLPGADFYVGSTGNDGNSGDIDAPFRTITNAIARATEAKELNPGRRIRVKVIDMVTKYFGAIYVDGIELYGKDRKSSGLIHASLPQEEGGTGYEYSTVVLRGDAFLHDLKIYGGGRAVGSISTSSESVVVSNCWISSSGVTGGYPAFNFSNGLITHTLIADCTLNNSESTIGLLSNKAKMRNSIVTGCRIGTNNRGRLDGIIQLGGNAELENCVVFSNTVAASSSKDGDGTPEHRPRNGAGIYVSSGSPIIRNCIIRDNMKPHAYMEEPGEIDILKPTEQGNFYIAAGATPVIKNCNIPEGQIPAGAVNCQTGDPLFVDATNTTAANRDFSIGAASPCRDAGRGNSLKIHRSGATDYKGNPRVMGRKIDIGACEYEEDFTPTGTMFLVR